ncbi:MAG: hypothetical protein ACOYLM_12010 [Methylococcaceae bacterium]
MISRFLFLSFVLLSLTSCAPTTRVNHVSDDVYNITETGGWGYDLKLLKSKVQNQAKQFAAAAGKEYELIDESVTPDTRVDIYPADDDTYSLTFRLNNKE